MKSTALKFCLHSIEEFWIASLNPPWFCASVLNEDYLILDCWPIYFHNLQPAPTSHPNAHPPNAALYSNRGKLSFCCFHLRSKSDIISRHIHHIKKTYIGTENRWSEMQFVLSKPLIWQIVRPWQWIMSPKYVRGKKSKKILQSLPKWRWIGFLANPPRSYTILACTAENIRVLSLEHSNENITLI